MSDHGIMGPELTGHITDLRNAEPASYQPVFIELCALLDAIEQALNAGEDDRARTLVSGRFEIMEKHGFEVVFSALPVTGRRM